MNHAGIICINKEVITEVNTITFEFNWRGKEIVKLSSLRGHDKLRRLGSKSRI